MPSSISSRMGDNLKEIDVIDAYKSSVYRYMNFDQIEEYVDGAKAVPSC